MGLGSPAVQHSLDGHLHPGAMEMPGWCWAVLETSWDSETLLCREKSCPEAKPALRSCVDRVSR